MHLFCRFGRHKAVPSKLWNDGHYFSACARCGKDLIRVPNGKWQEVPPTMKVVWRPRTEDDVVWPTQSL